MTDEIYERHKRTVEEIETTLGWKHVDLRWGTAFRDGDGQLRDWHEARAALVAAQS